MRAVARCAGALGVLVLSVSGCGLLHQPAAARVHTLTLAMAPGSVLIVITDPGSPAATREAASLIAATARTGERVLILDDRTGSTVASSTAPPPPSVRVPAPPPPLAPDPTSFQRARYDAAVRQYTADIRQAQATLSRLQHTELAVWAARTVASAQASLTAQRDQGADMSASLGAAAADLSSLDQIGASDRARTVIAIVGVGVTATQPAPAPPAGLGASTVVMDDFPASSGAEAAWQAGLLEAGATRVMLLTAGTDDELAPAVQEALDATITDTLTNVLFGLGQYKLSSAALPQLSQLLRLLTVRYADATATIVGYTDDLPTPGGNVRLSQLRAQAVAGWLVAHGVPAGRLQTYGYGDADPVAPNTPAGQPLNRRVDVIIDPALPPA